MKKDYNILDKNYSVTHLELPSTPGKFTLTLGRIVSIAKKTDLLYVWFSDVHAAVSVGLTRLLGKKSIVCIGGYDVARVEEIDYGLFTEGSIRQMHARFALSHANTVLAVDPSLIDHAVRNASVKSEHIIYLPTGYDSERWKPCRSKDRLVVTVGDVNESVIKRKGFRTFLEAARRIPDAKFALIGRHEDHFAEDLKKNSPANLEMPGFVSNDELLSYYQRAKVYCQLSLYEGLPNALCESMLCGCIPVGTQRSGIPRAIGNSGFYTSYGDIEGTVVSIQEALDAPISYSKRARERIKDNFPIEARERGVIEAVENLIEG